MNLLYQRSKENMSAMQQWLEPLQMSSFAAITFTTRILNFDRVLYMYDENCSTLKDGTHPGNKF